METSIPSTTMGTQNGGISEGAQISRPSTTGSGKKRRSMTPAAARNLEERLKSQIIGQEEAVKAVSRAVRRATAGVRDPKRPVASFLFTGPTGVGKTELACALAEEFYGSDQSLIRLDMSEYMEWHNVARLFGSPPGYYNHRDGGQLTKAIKQKPSSVVLFDEIEKAHPRVCNVLLQILDYGFMTDGAGEKADFRDAIIVMTSNVGQGAVVQGTPNGGDEGAAKGKVAEELKDRFKPELLNRIDDIVVFRALAAEEVKVIVEIMLGILARRIKSVKRIQLQVTEELKEKVAKEGYDPSYGARPLKRAIMRLVEDPLADAILDKRVKNGGSITLFPDGQLDGKNEDINTNTKPSSKNLATPKIKRGSNDVQHQETTTKSRVGSKDEDINTTTKPNSKDPTAPKMKQGSNDVQAQGTTTKSRAGSKDEDINTTTKPSSKDSTTPKVKQGSNDVEAQGTTTRSRSERAKKQK